MSAHNPKLFSDVWSDSTVHTPPISDSHGDEAQAITSANTFLSAPPQLLRRRSSANSDVILSATVKAPSFDSIHLDNNGIVDGFDKTFSNGVAVSRRSKWRGVLDELWIANYGAFLVLVSQFFGCAMTIATRLLETPGPHGDPMHPFQILFVRQAITSLFCIAFALWSKSIPDFPLGPAGTVRLLLFSRGFFGFLGVFGLYFSLIYLPLGEATILTFLAPIGTCYAFSILLPGETFSKRQQMAAFISLVGVVFIARPTWLFKASNDGGSVVNPDTFVATNSTMAAHQESSQPSPGQHLQAIGASMMGVLGAIGAFTSIRKIGSRAHPFLSVNYFSVWSAFVSGLALMFLPSVKFRLPANFMEWGLLFLIGVCGFCTQWLITVAMAYGASTPEDKISTITNDQDLEMQPSSSQLQSPTSQPISQEHSPQTPGPVRTSGSKATSMMYSSAVFALGSDKLVFGITPGLWSWLGSGLILAGAIWVAAEGAKSKTSSSDLADGATGQNPSVFSKGEGDGREEEVGLLRDVDDSNIAPEDDRPQAILASSSSAVSVGDTHETVIPRISVDSN